MPGSRRRRRWRLDGHLILAEGDAKVPPALVGTTTWLEGVGLDRSKPRRGIAVLAAGTLGARHFGHAGVTIYRPITPRIAAP